MIGVLRCVGAVTAGIVVTMALVVAVEMFGGAVHPLPPDFKGTFEEVCAHVESYPAWVLAVAAGMWGATAFIGTWTAGRLGNRWCAVVLGVLIIAAVIMNISMLPYPAWFKVACMVVIPGAIVWACRVAGKRRGMSHSKSQRANAEGDRGKG